MWRVSPHRNSFCVVIKAWGHSSRRSVDHSWTAKHERLGQKTGQQILKWSIDYWRVSFHSKKNKQSAGLLKTDEWTEVKSMSAAKTWRCFWIHAKEYYKKYTAFLKGYFLKMHHFYYIFVFIPVGLSILCHPFTVQPLKLLRYTYNAVAIVCFAKL